MNTEEEYQKAELMAEEAEKFDQLPRWRKRRVLRHNGRFATDGEVASQRKVILGQVGETMRVIGESHLNTIHDEIFQSLSGAEQSMAKDELEALRTEWEQDQAAKNGINLDKVVPPSLGENVMSLKSLSDKEPEDNQLNPISNKRDIPGGKALRALAFLAVY